jgi:sortase A
VFVRPCLRQSIRQPLWWLSNLLLLGGTGAIVASGWALLDGRLYQSVQKRQLEGRFESRAERGAAISMAVPPSVQKAPLWQPALLPILSKPDPLVMGELEIPRLGLDVVVREGVDDTSLRRAVGHLSSSALPGAAGNFVVLGHRDTFFRPLRGIEPGDTIRVRTAAGNFVYKVDSIQVTDPDWPGAVEQTREPVVTLITCFPFDYIGPAPRRFIVRAKPER